MTKKELITEILNLKYCMFHNPDDEVYYNRFYNSYSETNGYDEKKLSALRKNGLETIYNELREEYDKLSSPNDDVDPLEDFREDYEEFLNE